MPLLDTRRGRDLTGVLIADIVLQLLSYVAEVERRNTRQRQAEGIAAAKKRGIRFGRAWLPFPENFETILAGYIEKRLAAGEAAELCGMSKSTFYRRCREWKPNEK